MILAACYGRSEVVALLAEKGANIQAQDKVRENTLSYTNIYRHTYIHVINFIRGILYN